MREGSIICGILRSESQQREVHGSSFAGQGAGAMNGLHWSMGLPCLQCCSCQTDKMVGIA